MASLTAERRRALKQAYIAEHGGAPSRLDRLLEDAGRWARLRGSMSCLGFALAQVGVIETCRVREADPGVLLERIANGDEMGPLLTYIAAYAPARSVPTFPAPMRALPEGERL